MYTQRPEPPENPTIRGLWQPTIEPEQAEFLPTESDRYAVVDDIEAGQVVLVVSRWPEVDELGNLIFADRAVSRHIQLDRLQVTVSQQRQTAGQPAAHRMLRVGDVFWIRGAGVDKGKPAMTDWRILDVTRAARRAARAAQLVAASPALRTEPAETPPEPVQPPPSQPPTAGTALPGV